MCVVARSLAGHFFKTNYMKYENISFNDKVLKAMAWPEFWINVKHCLNETKAKELYHIYHGHHQEPIGQLEKTEHAAADTEELGVDPASLH